MSVVPETMGVNMYRIVTEGEVISPRGLCAVLAVPWSLSDLETTRDVRELVPGPVLCSTSH